MPLSAHFQSASPGPASTSPGEGFTDFFRALDAKAKSGGVEPRDMQQIAAEYGIAIG
jgi:hypothetical protein